MIEDKEVLSLIREQRAALLEALKFRGDQVGVDIDDERISEAIDSLEATLASPLQTGRSIASTIAMAQRIAYAAGYLRAVAEINDLTVSQVLESL